MYRLKKDSEEGFTLTELMVAISIFSVIIVVIYNIMFNSSVFFRRGEDQAQKQEDARRVEQMISNTLSYATNIEILNDPNLVTPENIDHQNFDYIYLNANGDIVFYPRSLSVPRVIAHSKGGSQKGDYGYDLEFKRAGEKSVDVRIATNTIIDNAGTTTQDINISTGVFAENSGLGNNDNGIIGNRGMIIRYLPGIEAITQRQEEGQLNLFWRDFVTGAVTGAIEMADGYTFNMSGSGEELSAQLTDDGGNTSASGGLIFTQLIDRYFEGTTGNIDSYSLIVDAALSGGWGYGVLLRGAYDPDKGIDWGYMFQFDPGAKGFVLRRIQGGWHRNPAYVGAKRDDGQTIGSYNAIYKPTDLENDDFKWKGNEDWHKRYNTIIKVQTQPNDDLIIRVRLEDKTVKPHAVSEEMWFGNFGNVELAHNKTFTGGNINSGGHFDANKGLDWDYFDYWDNGHQPLPSDLDLPGRYFALRSWTGSGDTAYNVKFYEVIVAGAEPAVKEVEHNNSSPKVIRLIFDEEITLLLGEEFEDLVAGSDYYTESSLNFELLEEIMDKSKDNPIKKKIIDKFNEDFTIGSNIQIENVELDNDEGEPIVLKLILESNIWGGEIIYSPELADENLGILSDYQGNLVEGFRRDF
ncbi:PilW family protein [Orenia marismortui]|uniref:PilW family protein n=1 Tax=Orenia marismortui TaxID=46469 RepID=UPI000369AFE7|nr:prepilin-type N-terminal cleavage/methylation domain-containing protein [Orenia marismortui]